ncbi:MAG: preprotein translocase subunit YajC [Alphaproteobacteria bacterium]|nr:preprotein translocase subunit YajC [Alphaproteobacteria bacterium]HCP00440.1 preprotein translocase subunit YajC [Rhodospirillaceae bacterium]
MFITPAYAQMGGGGDAFASFLPIILIFVVFYFLLIRPQQKKMKQHRAMLGQVKRGDRVLTGGGIIGTVTKVKEENDEVTVEIADGVKVDIVRGTISDVFTSTPSASGNAQPGGKGVPTVVGPAANGGKAGSGLLGGLFGGRK